MKFQFLQLFFELCLRLSHRWQPDEGHQNNHFEPILNPMGIFSNDDDDGNENIKKAIGLTTKITHSTRAIHSGTSFLPLLHD